MIEFGDKESNRKKEKFLNMMNDLATVWPGINNKSRLKQYYQHVERLPEKAWEDITELLMDSFRTVPLPKDFREAAIAWRKSHEIYDASETFEPNVNNCNECFDSGMIFIKVKSSEPTVFMYCECFFGKQSMANHGFQIPQWNTTFDQMGFLRQEFDLDFFKPELTGEIKLSKIKTKLDEFRDRMRSSQDYFEELSARQRRNEISL